MKFSVSPHFNSPLYADILQNVAKDIDTYREISGTNLTEIMAAVHISYPMLKKC